MVSEAFRDQLDALGFDIAKAKLLDGRSFEQLAKDYPYSKAALHRRFQRWQEAKRFEIVDTWDTATTARVDRLEEDLAEDLARRTLIWRSRVARIIGADHAYTSEYQADPGTAAAQMAFSATDALHSALGEVAADLLLNSLTPQMTVGLASGRAVGFAVAKLEDLKRGRPAWFSGYKSLRIVSLCGGTRVGRWDLATGRDFDADGNAYYLAGTFQVPLANRHYMHGWISQTAEQRPHLDETPSLDLALVGLGVLNTQHHFFRHNAEVQLGAMAKPLERIRKCQQADADLLNSVADIGHRLFPLGRREDLPGELLGAIDQINDVIWAVPGETIREARHTILIAGGAQKVNGLLKLVAGACPEAPVNLNTLTLVTDAWTAREILARVE